MPLPVAADGGVFLSGNGTPVCAEHGALAGPSSGGQRVQDADGSTDAGGLSQTAGTGRIEDFNHNDRFQSVRSYGMKRMIGMNRFRHGRRIGNRCKYRLRGSLWRSHKRRVPEQREAAPGLRESLLGYAADFSGSGTRVSGSISGFAGDKLRLRHLLRIVRNRLRNRRGALHRCRSARRCGRRGRKCRVPV